MEFGLTEEQRELQKWAHDFAEKEIRPVAPHYDETEEFPWDVLKKAAEVGLLLHRRLRPGSPGPGTPEQPRHPRRRRPGDARARQATVPLLGERLVVRRSAA